MSFIILIASLILILLGANYLTDGAAAVARRYGISDMVVGLTIVALGTSAPEFIVSLMSALHGSSDMAIGNVVGSNLFNTLAIVGVTALITPIHVDRGTLSKDLPLNLLACVVLAACANDILLDAAEVNSISRVEGIMFIGLFLIFLRHTFSLASEGVDGNQEAEKTFSEGEKRTSEGEKGFSRLRCFFYILGGLVALIVGGNWFVESASAIARMMGVEESIIALTLMAGGTSLPELATSVVAARKGNVDMAIGNVIGSNIFNIFLILGVCSCVTPLGVGNIGNLELLTLVLSGLLLWFTGQFYRERTVTRIEGALMLGVYVGYTALLILR